MLCYCQGDVPADVLAVMRLSWYKHGRVRHVEEAQLMDCDQALLVMHHIVSEALQQGVDVSMICAHDPEEIGIPV